IIFVRAVSLGIPLEDVTITVYTSTGLIDQISVSGADGKALVDINENNVYYVRASKNGRVTSIYELPTENDTYEIEVPTNELLPAIDLDRCRIQGHIINVLGDPSNWPIKVSAFEGVARSQEGIIYGDADIHPDSSGKYDFELVRGVSYVVYGLPEGGATVCHVPNASAIRIQDFIFPTLTILEDLPNNITINVAEEVEYAINLKLSNGLDGDIKMLEVSSSTNAAQATLSLSSLKLKGMAKGSTVVTLSQLVDIEECIYGSLRGNDLHSITVEVI
ncbi:MAG: hypothetical protein VXZ72_01565, partial [Chlamydiota bacterium]|nr:hypothetical protein [Chlamydiota bacterium]